MAIVLRIFKKGADLEKDLPLAEGTEAIPYSAFVKDIAPGTNVQTGDYIALNHDTTGAVSDSPVVDIPGFTMPKTVAETPNNINVKPGENGGVSISEGNTNE
ncbi:hypothetical protein [Apilactobacillus micheneri]|uniref:hypothetical protein n=1 Tax=Apilactobacillus micheneri TaxID=1899430 RepID=UPI00112A368C|nr:hypothetical protein [Apilactobacillus micheneri]TPR40408.1 hypothetical protein DY119_01590 [Apilactobacillus micheneri]